jgi:hypothetical protein
MKATDISDWTTAVQSCNLGLPKHEASRSVISLNCVQYKDEAIPAFKRWLYLRQTIPWAARSFSAPYGVKLECRWNSFCTGENCDWQQGSIPGRVKNLSSSPCPSRSWGRPDLHPQYREHLWRCCSYRCIEQSNILCLVPRLRIRFIFIPPVHLHGLLVRHKGNFTFCLHQYVISVPAIREWYYFSSLLV